VPEVCIESYINQVLVEFCASDLKNKANNIRPVANFVSKPKEENVVQNCPLENNNNHKNVNMVNLLC